LLPLAGTPRLIVLGREVQLGNGYADLIAIEPTGRIAIIEIKLARNAEARRAVIAQVLAYAAYLWKLDQTTLEQEVLNKHLRDRGYKSLAHAVESNDQEGSTGEGWLADGAADFIASIDAASETSKPLLQRLCNWAISLENEHLVKLSTYHGKAGILTLLPRLRG
jgi:RecB family exonuclease